MLSLSTPWGFPAAEPRSQRPGLFWTQRMELASMTKGLSHQDLPLHPTRHLCPTSLTLFFFQHLIYLGGFSGLHPNAIITIFVLVVIRWAPALCQALL